MFYLALEPWVGTNLSQPTGCALLLLPLLKLVSTSALSAAFGCVGFTILRRLGACSAA